MLTALYGCGKPAAVVDGSAQRIVSLTPGNTEILFALGLDKEIVGVTTYCNYPLQAISKEKIGDFSNPNVEKIIALKPTLILSTDFEQANVSKKLRSFNLNVYDVNPRNLLELYNAIITVGELTGKSKEARALADSIKSKIDSICENVSKKPKRPGIFVEINSSPLMTASNGSFIHEMVEILGKNIATGLPRPFCVVSQEFVIQKNPDVIILAGSTKKDVFLGKFNFKNVSAVKNNLVIDDVNPDMLVRPSPRVAEGIEALYERIYKKK